MMSTAIAKHGDTPYPTFLIVRLCLSVLCRNTYTHIKSEVPPWYASLRGVVGFVAAKIQIIIENPNFLAKSTQRNKRVVMQITALLLCIWFPLRCLSPGTSSRQPCARRRRA